jgi:hypothetical protein
VADKIKDNKDAEESGRPVQLDRDEPQKPGQQHQDKPQHDKSMEHGQKPGQQPTASR